MALLLRWISSLLPSANIDVVHLSLRSKDSKRIEMLQEGAANMALCREIFRSWQEQIDEQLSTRKPKLNRILRDFQQNVTVLSDHYNVLTMSCGDLAETGIELSREMIKLIDYIVLSKGYGAELRDHLTAATKKSDALSQMARTLQDKFRNLNERLEAFHQNLTDTKPKLERKQRKEEWWRRFFDIAISFLTALSVALGAIGFVAAAAATGPVGIATGGGLIAAAALSGTLVEALGYLVDLSKNRKSSPETRLEQVIKVISSIEDDIPIITEHVSALEAFCSHHGNTLSALTDQDRRIKFSGGTREIMKLQESKQEWQNVQANFETYRGNVQLGSDQTSSHTQLSSTFRLSR